MRLRVIVPDDAVLAFVDTNREYQAFVGKAYPTLGVREGWITMTIDQFRQLWVGDPEARQLRVDAVNAGRATVLGETGDCLQEYQFDVMLNAKTGKIGITVGAPTGRAWTRQ